MNISIIGGGNIGTLMAADFASKGHKVLMYTTKIDKWNKDIEVFNAEEKLLYTGTISVITNSMREAMEWSDIVFVTVPAHILKNIAKNMYTYVDKQHKIGIIPGTGGAEFAFREIIKKGCVLFGLQRVHSVARLKEYGKSVYECGKRDCLKLSTIPSGKKDEICEIVKKLFEMPCVTVSNYLAITLTPSNPILHTSRLYCLFKNHKLGEAYERNPMFYDEWDDETSRWLIACDRELQSLCDKIPLDLSGVASLKSHYESETVEEMTAKIRSIKAFKGLTSPMIKNKNGWIIDVKS